jgi:hypothetical protein
MISGRKNNTAQFKSMFYTRPEVTHESLKISNKTSKYEPGEYDSVMSVTGQLDKDDVSVVTYVELEEDGGKGLQWSRILTFTQKLSEVRKYE